MRSGEREEFRCVCVGGGDRGREGQKGLLHTSLGIQRPALLLHRVAVSEILESSARDGGRVIKGGIKRGGID